MTDRGGKERWGWRERPNNRDGRAGRRDWEEESDREIGEKKAEVGRERLTKAWERGVHRELGEAGTLERKREGRKRNREI